jgi:hypothetical protein
VFPVSPVVLPVLLHGTHGCDRQLSLRPPFFKGVENGVRLGVLCTARTRRHALCCLTSESKRVAPAEASQLRRLTRKNYMTTSMRRGP